MAMDYTKIPLLDHVSPPDDRDFPITKLIGASVVKLPDEFILPYDHEVKNQGQNNTCVANSLAYCREIVEEQQTGKYQKLSVGFLYGNRYATDYQDEGWAGREALEHLIKEGACAYELFQQEGAYKDMYNLVQANKDALYKDAYPRRITAYARIGCSEDLAQALVQLNSPVSVAMKICNSFYHVNRYNPVLEIYPPGERLLGYHEVTVTGYKNYNGRKVFVVLNSWGKEWCLDGYFYMPFEVFDSYVTLEGWSITDNILPGQDNVTPPTPEPQPKPEPKPEPNKEVYDMDTAILIYTQDDLETAKRLFPKYGLCAVFFRDIVNKNIFSQDVFKAKHLITVGGPKVGHPNETLLSGNSWFDTNIAVGKHVGAL
jgi:hypothetical protein